MHLKNSYAEHYGGMNPVAHSIQYSLDLTLDILEGCEFKCAGCFNHRSLNYLNDDLTRCREMVEEMNELGFDFNELTLGPTDLFSADNFYEVVKNPDFIAMSKYFTFTSTSTLMSDTDEIKRRLEFLDDHCANWRDRKFEMFLQIDLEKYLAGDIMYLDKFNRNLKLLEQNNIFFITNVYPNMFDKMSWKDIAIKLKDEYNTKLRINPSYLRTTNKRYVEDYAYMHRDYIMEEKDNMDKIFLNMMDTNFSSLTTSTLTLTKGELYITPFLYENLPAIHELFRIPQNDENKYDINSIFEKEQWLYERQYDLANQLYPECGTCPQVHSCVARNVLNFREVKGINYCFIPKDVMFDVSVINDVR